MHPRFEKYVADLETAFRHLLEAKPVLPTELPADMPVAGVYLFSERGRHLYVGRSNALRRRIRRMHVRYVEESDPVKQALLEIYVATVLKTRYNDFDTH